MHVNLHCSKNSPSSVKSGSAYTSLETGAQRDMRLATATQLVNGKNSISAQIPSFLNNLPLIFIVKGCQNRMVSRCFLFLLNKKEETVLNYHMDFFFFFFLSFLPFIGPLSRHMEFPGQGSNCSCSHRPTPEPQQHGIRTTSATYTTAQGNAGLLTH